MAQQLWFPGERALILGYRYQKGTVLRKGRPVHFTSSPGIWKLLKESDTDFIFINAIILKLKGYSIHNS